MKHFLFILNYNCSLFIPYSAFVTIFMIVIYKNKAKQPKVLESPT
jgi:hypothetical protein